MPETNQKLHGYHRSAWAIRPSALARATRALAERNIDLASSMVPVTDLRDNDQVAAAVAADWGDGLLARVEAAQAAEATRSDRGRSFQIAGGVAVIPLRGIITPAPSLMSLLFGGSTGGLRGFRSSLREALGDDDISAIVIDVDSPGGHTDLVAETAAELFEARGTKPIVAIANTMAASAAYWIASQADELVVTPSGELGSIGVFAIHDDFSEMDKAMGIKTTIIKAGKFKAEANPFEPLSKEAEAHIQETVDTFYGMFTDAVAKGRGVSQDAVQGGFGEGRIITAEQAVSLGMADATESFEATIQRVTDGGTRRTRAVASGAPSPRAEADPPAEDPPAGPPAEPQSEPAPEPDPEPEETSEEEDEPSEEAAQSAAERYADVVLSL